MGARPESPAPQRLGSDVDGKNILGQPLDIFNQHSMKSFLTIQGSMQGTVSNTGATS